MTPAPSPNAPRDNSQTHPIQPPAGTEFFGFEADFVESLRCIPMQVRFQLDRCGVKLKLEHWHRFSEGDRLRLTQLPGEDVVAYARAVQALVCQVQGAPASTLPIDPKPSWESDSVPAEVSAQAAQVGAVVLQNKWRSLTPLQRFALIKLSRPSHENRNFYPALVEFGLVP